MDPLSGPMGSPFDTRKISYGAGQNFPTYTPDGANQTPSTGGLSTGIGIGPNRVIGLTPDLPVASTPVYAIFRAGFNDDMVPGNKQTFTAPPPPGNTASNVDDSRMIYIGGGRSNANVNGIAPTVPYTAGVALLGAGNGASRDAGAGPAFTGFPLKMVTAAGAVAIGAAIEGTFINRSGAAMVLGQSAFGSSNTASAVPS
jgi:hypothetical protein